MRRFLLQSLFLMMAMPSPRRSAQPLWRRWGRACSAATSIAENLAWLAPQLQSLEIHASRDQASVFDNRNLNQLLEL